MTTTQHTEGWWQASDGRWYPPSARFEVEPEAAPDDPTIVPDRPSRAGIPTWAKIAGALVAALALFGAGSAVGAGNHTALDAANKRTAAVQAKLITAKSQTASVQAQLTTLEARQAALQATVTEATGKLADATNKLGAQQSAVTAQKAFNDQRSSQLDAQAAALAARTAAADASSIGDGLFQVGADIKAGRYHTAGAASGCYWAKLRSSDTSNIADNSNSPGPQTIVIDSAYFQSTGCGTWTKVG